MKAEDVEDEGSLRRWLESLPRDTPEEEAEARRWAVVIAHRAAMRALPVGWAHLALNPSRETAHAALSALRLALITGVASVDPASEIKAATAAAFAGGQFAAFEAGKDSAAANAAVAAMCDAAAAVADLPAAHGSAYASTGAAAAHAVADTAHAFSEGLFSSAFDDPAVLAAFGRAFAATSWRAALADCISLEAGEVAMALPLWPEGNPIREDILALREALLAAGDGWSFWVDWYDRALEGRAQDWDLLTEVALIPSEDWEKGAAHVNGLIAGIRMQHALRRTDNAERIEVNPETGRLRLVPESALPGDIGAYARRKMKRAVEMFDDAAANQYRPMEPALRVVRDAVREAPELPVELYDACARSSRLVKGLARNEVIPRPDQDALIEEYLRQMQDIAADILGNDPKTREVLERRNAALGNSALIEARDSVLVVADRIAAVSEGRLATALPEDAAIATSVDSDREDRNVSGFRLAGRVLRVVALWPFRAARAYGEASLGAKELWKDSAPLRETEEFKEVIRAAMEWLGL